MCTMMVMVAMCGMSMAYTNLDVTQLVDIWPFPSDVQLVGNYTLPVQSKSFGWGLATPTGFNTDDLALINRAIDRYRKLCFPAAPFRSSTLYRSNIFEHRINGTNPSSTRPVLMAEASLAWINVHIQSVERVNLSITTDESYELRIEVSPPSAWLTAPNIWGAIRGLESFSQLIIQKPANVFSIANTPLVIKDTPRFPWRGLMIDSARHYLPLHTIRKGIDGMAYNKMNVLHWHLSDAESFPFQSKVWPDLSGKGAYSTNAIYTHDDIRGIVAYARDRGIRVIGEIDTPGHVASWGNGYPEITADCWKYYHDKTGRLEWPAWDNIALNPTRNATYEFVRQLFAEVIPLFPDQNFHLGGDEVATACWKADASITEWMRNNGYASNSTGTWVYEFRRLQAYWMQFVQQLVKESSPTRQSVVWEEAFTDAKEIPLLNDTIIHVWTNPQSLPAAIAAGKQALMSYGWYLDRQAPICTTPNSCKTNWMFVWTWHDMYSVEPLSGLDFDPTPEQVKLLLGGEACSWGESVDESNFDERVWTRGPAVSERLWSPREVNNTQLAQWRLSSFQCKLARRGILSSPSQPSYCEVLDIHVGLPSDHPDKDSSASTKLNTITIAMITVAGVSVLLNLYLCCKKPSGSAINSNDYNHM